MQKIALIEAYGHSEVLRTFGKLLQAGACELWIWARPSVREDCFDVEGERVHWQELTGEGHAVDWKAIQPALMGMDVLVFITLLEGVGLEALGNVSAPKLLLVHNGHRFFGGSGRWALWHSGQDRLANVLRAVRWWVRGEGRAVRSVLSQMDAISFPNVAIDEFMCRNYASALDSVAVLPPLPWQFFEGRGGEQAKVEIDIIVPGTLKAQVRDYDLLFRAFEQLVGRYEGVVRLTFLGEARPGFGQRQKLRWRSLESEQLQLTFFDQKVPQILYDKMLQVADFMILPLYRQDRVGAIMEELGKTKITGGENDMIRFGIPCLLSDFYPLPADLESLVGRFGSAEELAELLLEWIESRAFERIRLASRPALEARSLENMQQKMKQLLASLASPSATR
ncbi:MAG: hypothetical protein AAFV95_19470 [Bacteroidota bacterium]